MVKIRLTRIGRHDDAIYRIVVADSHYTRDGRFIEQIGQYNPKLGKDSIVIDEEKALAWLGKGDSVYSNTISRNLMEWGRYNPAQVLSHNNSTASQVFNFDKIVLPNVRNAHDFYMELQKLPNIAIQQSIRRY